MYKNFDAARIKEQIWKSFNVLKGVTFTGHVVHDPRIDGVPQGGPHSPLLAMMCKTVVQKVPKGGIVTYLKNHIQYVDDGITDREVSTVGESGSFLNKEKSG
jgi:hypothetical protein